MNSRGMYTLTWTCVWAIGMALSILGAVYLAEGHLIYSLDDPYIHLSVAESILEGSWGINPAEFSSPSSSILFPILLSLTLMIGLGSAGPLVINIIAAGLSVWLLLDYFWGYAVGGIPEKRPLFANLAAPLLILAINAITLPLTGMEHSLHLLLVIVTMRGLVTLGEGGRPHTLMMMAIIAMPFIRFEGLALSGIAVIVLILLRHRRAAVLSAIAILLCLCSYGVTMQYLGLPLLPSSVLLKSEIAASIGDSSSLTRTVRTLGWHILGSVENRWGLTFALVIVALIGAARGRDGNWRSLRSPEVLLGGTMVAALGAHLVAGRYGSFGRYEVYAVCIMLMGGAYLLRSVWRRLDQPGYAAIRLAIVAALVVLLIPYMQTTRRTPFASRNIYEQQYQMHRFATAFFPRGVAVNDIGWVAYDNSNYVLDLVGLGSEAIRHLRATGKQDAEAIIRLTRAANIDYAMIYDRWFERNIPDSWCRLAILQTDRITAALGEVSFYATSESVQAEMNTALDRFEETLPERVNLQRASCDRH